MKKMLLPALLLGLVFQAIAQKASSPAPVFVGTVESVKEYRLANGLQVLLVPDPTINNLIVDVTYRVGSRHEGYGETGMAHLLEHMLFKGSKKFRNIKETIANKGAFANGTTWYDRTTYYEILPASDSNLYWALDMESDRMVNSLMRNEDLQKEFTVVRNEFEMGENSPAGILEERVVSGMYLWHNYGKSTIGSKEDIEKVPIENLRKFYQKYYQPDNATLVVGGKFDEKKTLELIGKLFGPIAKPARTIQPPYTVEPPQDGARSVELRRNGDIQYIGLAYHTPAYADKDYMANKAVIDILTNDPAGIFYKALVETKLATKVNGYAYVLYDPGFSYYSCEVPREKSLDSARRAFETVAGSLPGLAITQDEFDRAKNNLLKHVSDVQNNTLNFCLNLVESIGAGDYRLFFINRDRLEKLAMADAQGALKKYYLPTNATWGFFIPDKEAERERVVVGERPDIDALVKGYKGKASQVQTTSFETTIANIKKHTQYFTAANGFHYAVLTKPVKADKIRLSMTLKFGDETSLNGKDQLSSLTARMLKNGTTSRSKKDINDQLAKLKSSIDISGGSDALYVNLVTDKENLKPALDLLGDLLLHPSFDKNEFDKMMLDIKGETEANRSDPEYVAGMVLGRKASPYPKGHPLYTENTEEILADLAKIQLSDLQQFYQQFFGANHGYGTFVGAVADADVKPFVDQVLDQFNSKQSYQDIEQKYFNIPSETLVEKIADKKNAICLGNINIPLKQTDPDFPALDMANEILGGGAFLNSRIANRLRETEGMSYGAGSYLDASVKYQTTNWGVYAIFNPAYKNRLDSALHDEITKALKNGFTQDELKKSVAAWLEQRKTYLGLDNYLVAKLTEFQLYQMDLSYHDDYENKVKALTLDQVNVALRKYINPDKLILVYAGDFK